MDKLALNKRISELEQELIYLKRKRNDEDEATSSVEEFNENTTIHSAIPGQLQLTDKFLNSIIEQSPTALWISDHNGTLIWMNQACRNFLLLRDEDVVGKYNILKDNVLVARGVMPMVEDVFKKGKIAHFIVDYDTREVEGLSLDNTVSAFLHINISPIIDEHGKVTNAIIQHVDITKQKMAEDALIESEKKLQKLNADKDRFISIIGHDLIGPFNPILGLLHLLSENIRNYDIEKTEKMIQSLHISAFNVYSLLQETLDWVNAQSGKLPFQPQLLNFEEICSHIAEVLHPNLAKKNITVDYFIKDDTLLYADMNMIKTILRNLVSNAVKFTREGGWISISAESDSGQTTLSVCDNGIGIAPDDRAKLFDDSFIFSTKGTSQEKGSGLGLIICKEFVKKHGGHIWVESEPGKGSCFRFTIPTEHEGLTLSKT